VDVDDPEVGSVTLHKCRAASRQDAWQHSHAAPALGQHTVEVLRADGYNEAQIQRASSVARDE